MDKDNIFDEKENLAKITFEFDYWIDRDEVKSILNIGAYRSSLEEIFNICRSQLKHSDDWTQDKFMSIMENIKDLSWVEDD